jgi:guanosine-3',5'-bis(diphosphate) 3'-pyrophosphohydrolase
MSEALEVRPAAGVPAGVPAGGTAASLQEPSQQGGTTTSRTGLALLVIVTGVLITAVDTTIVVLALPEIEKSLHVGVASVIWVIIGYLLVITLLATQVGRLGDMYGRVRMYETGFAVFLLGSLLCALSWNEASIIVFRLVQGVGGALVTANSGAVIADIVPEERRGRAYGYNAVGWSAGAILGILLGGLIVTYISWRWIFWINLPIGAVALSVALKVLHDRTERRPHRLDPVGMVTLGLGLFGVLWAMTRLATVAFDASIAGYLAGGLALLVVFVLVERAQREPMVALSIFRLPTMTPSLLASFFQAVASFAVLFLVIMYLQGVRDLSPLHASLLLVPGYTMSGLVAPLAGRLADRLGPVVPATGGLGLAVVALVIYAQLGTATPLGVVVLASVVNGTGNACFFPANTAAVMRAAPKPVFGIASGMLRTFANVGMVFSFAVAILVSSQTISRKVAFEVFVGTHTLSHHVAASFTAGLHASFYASAGTMVLAAALSMAVVPQRTERPGARLPDVAAAAADVLTPKLDTTVTTEVDAIIAALERHRPGSDLDLVRRTHALAVQAHEGQQRLSGEAFVTHPVAVGTIVAELGLDAVSVAAALLHDAVEDTAVDLEEIEKGFGADVAAIVDGVTKLDRLRFDSKEAQQAATMRKMLVAMAKDWRVLVVKLADRLHNMRTIAAVPPHKQGRIATETLDIYAPLAHRLGIQEIKWQLEDLSFFTLHPKRYAEIAEMVATRAPRREAELAEVLAMVRARLETAGIEGEVTGRSKHLWSIYEKMVVRGKEFDEIYDLLGIRVVVGSDKDCWAALGSIHSIWAPVQGRFKDYVNSPKFNLYQSLHTTVVGPQGKPVEVQIRTQGMHRRAEYGIAAHWDYKAGSSSRIPRPAPVPGQPALGPDEAAAVAAADGRPEPGAAPAPGPVRARSPEEVAWFQRMVEWERDARDPEEFLEMLKSDLEQDEVYVFTPKGEVLTLPSGATPVDFAYSIHTEVGHRCIGARVNGRLVPLESKLQSGDTVEIFTSKAPTAGPSRDWLQIVASPRARNKIRQWFSRERREDAIDAGREELLKALRREGLPAQKLSSSPMLAAVGKELSHPDLESLHAAIGEGHVSARSVVQRLRRDLSGGEADVQLPTTALQPRRTSKRAAAGIYVEGLDDVMVRLARCCTPVPGDGVVGFVTRGRGVSVHRSDCANAISLAGGGEERVIEVEWDTGRAGQFVAGIEVKALDRSRLLADVAKVLAEHHVNILSSSSHTAPDRVSRMRFEFELADPAHLESLLGSLRRLESVYDAYRLLPGKGGSGALRR